MISFLFLNARLPFDRSNTKLPRPYGFDPLTPSLRTAPSQYHTFLLIFYSHAAVKDSHKPCVVDALRVPVGVHQK
ncbi:hypothetical protein BRARA_E01752 [Brassica rapa]|uniref:Uncharacterized protein n=1 Tax=Brassica campestris TaxID=3711 RepID=A0A397ZCK2_BRACM|nr:hypothetical protein BRARA_E01752 [Brassica rapa]